MRTALLLMLFLGLTGCGTPSFLVTPVSNTNALQEHEVQPGRGWSQPKIVIVEVEGMLMNARSGGFLQPTENPVSLFAQELDRAARDPRVKAIVLRVNSPGGTVTASDTMYGMVSEFRKKTKKPVIAATQEMAASGGYYVALASDKIVAHPTSVVGSIGVIFNTFDIEGTMGKIGVRSEAIKSGPLKDMGSPFHRLTEPERAVMQGMVDEYHQRFVAVVKAHRPITDEKTLSLVTDGRVFSGEQAKALGLVDETGSLEDALRLAKEMGQAPNARVILYKRPYGYGGSIYADSATPQPRANVLKLELPFGREMLPTGFYYLWDAW
jgi:protease IV